MNELLVWMSARVEGSWQQFRSAVEMFHVDASSDEDTESGDDAVAGELPFYQVVRLGLERLAHVEFHSSGAEKRWRVVPPTIALNQHNGQWVGVLCGARSPSVCPALDRLPNTLSWDKEQIPGMPDRIRLVASDSGTLSRVGEAMGFLVQREAPAALLTAIPPVDDVRSRFPKEPPLVPGWTIDQFSTVTFGWVAAGPDDLGRTHTGLFRFRMSYQRFHFLRWQGRTFWVPVQVGKYAVLRHHRIRRVMRYDHARAVLSVPLSCRPPLLVERALVLCSGLLAYLDAAARRLEYRQVPPGIAQLAAAVLRQEIESR